MNTNKHFGECLKDYIERKGLAVHKQAQKISVSYQGYLKYYESENPRPTTKKKILDGLEITEEQLLGIDKRNDDSDLELRIRELEKKLMQTTEKLLKYQEKEIRELHEINH